MERTQLAAFKTWGFDVKDWRRNTRDMYAGNIRRADAWLRANRDISLADATTDDLKAFLFEQSTSASTRNNYRNALVGYFDYLTDVGRRNGDGNPADPLPRYRVPRPLPKTMAAQAVRAVLDAAHDWGPMWTCAVTMLLYGGMRSTEARTVEWGDVAGGWMTFTQKGGQERALPLHERIVEALDAWRTWCPSPTYVYPSPRVEGQPVSEAWWSRIIARIGDKAGLEIRLHPHLMRHTAATRLLENGASVRAVQEFLGHAELSSTQRYTHVRPEQLVQTVDRLDYQGA